MQQALRDALIGFLAATAQANAEAIKEAQMGGTALARAKEGDIKYSGFNPTFNHLQFTTEHDMDGQAVGKIAKSTGLSRQTVYRIKADPAAAEAVFAI